MAIFKLTMTFYFGKIHTMKTNSQRHISQIIGISEAQFSRILSGKRRASPEVAEALSILTSSDFKIWLFNSEKNILNRKKIIRGLRNNGKKGDRKHGSRDINNNKNN